MFYPPYPGA